MNRRHAIRLCLSSLPGLTPIALNSQMAPLSSQPAPGRVDVYLTEYYPFVKNMTRAEREMEGGELDRHGNPLHTLDDFLAGKAPWASLACDYTGGPPGSNKAFTRYGQRVSIPLVDEKVGKHLVFRLVDTGSYFYGEGKKIRLANHEPIDICRSAPNAGGFSFNGPAVLLIG